MPCSLAKTKMFNNIKEFFGFGKKEAPHYPSDWAMVDWSSGALENGITDNHNKIITRFFYNKFGYLKTKVYPFSEPRVYALRTIHKVPVYDKTIFKKQRFPVYGRITPSEAKFKTRNY